LTTYQNINTKTKAEKTIHPNGSFFQPKLTINNPKDKFEQEADAVADKVLQMQTPSLQTKPDNNSFFKTSPITITPVQRKCANCEDEEKMQRKEIDGDEAMADSNLENYVGGLSGGGQQLPDEARKFYEPRFGYDFSNVKVHTDDVAAKSAQSINALAYTSGSNIVFNNGQFAPNTNNGKKLLGHELTHVVQQGNNISKKSIQRWSWGGFGLGAGVGGGIGAIAGGILGGVFGGPIGAVGGALLGGLAGSLIGGVIGGLAGTNAAPTRRLNSPRLDNNTLFEDILNGKTVMKIGDTSMEVRRIQQLLIDLGFPMLVNGANGTFNAETEAGVKEFQKKELIPDTGIVDAVTIEKFDKSFPVVTLPLNRTDPWNMACILEILCPWNKNLVENVLPKFDIITFDSRTFPTETWDGASWVPGTFVSGGFKGGNKMGFSNTTSCEEFAFTVYHEGWHAQQPSSLTGVVDTEKDAYINTEQWSIDMGVPGQGGLRTKSGSGEDIVDEAASESLVRGAYGGVSSVPGERILHRVGATNVRVRKPDSTEYERPANPGESIRKPVVMTNKKEIDPVDWKCP
jgi:hypothetical protein